MKFFEHQDQARSQTRKLLILFGLGILTMIIAVNWSCAYIWSSSERSEMPFEFHALLAAVTSLIILVSSFLRYGSLRQQGGISLALELGGKSVEPTTTIANERRLLNIVEEMSIASGVPMPEVFVYKDGAINAFAIGLNPKDAAVGVTQGCLDLLSRDELQAVMGHEFSHILNGDMKLNARIHSCIHGMMSLSSIGRLLLRGGRGTSRSRNRGGAAGIGLAFLIIGWLGTIVGKLIQAAMSRQREYLADASAVQFTRNPSALASALQKIMGQTQQAFSDNSIAAEMQHMFFSSTVRHWLGDITATHPPLEDRVRRVLGKSEDIKIKPITMPASPSKETNFSQISSLSPQVAREPITWIESMSTPLKASIQEIYSVRAVMYALFASQDLKIRSQQEAEFKRRHQVGIWRQTENLSAEIYSAGPQARLALVEIALPALRRLSHAQKIQFFDLLDILVRADQKLTLQEFALIQILKVNLLPHSLSTQPPDKQELRDSIVVLIGAFIHLSARDGQTKHRLASKFIDRWGRGFEKSIEWQDSQTGSLEQSLQVISHLPLSARESLIESIGEAVLFDQQASPEELELLKCVSLALGTSIPQSLRDFYLKAA